MATRSGIAEARRATGRAPAARGAGSGKVVGLDGCPDGWIAAVVERGRLAAIEYAASAGEAIEAHPDAEVFAIDIPIGLSEDGVRAADDAARRFLRDRASTVFRAPPLAALGAAGYAEASEASRRATGHGISRQSFALAGKIREVAALAADPRVHEAHPEVSFAEMAGEPLARKKSWDGLMLRRALLSARGLAIPDLVGEASRRGAADDIVDAVACAWTAGRIARGEARTFPDPPQRLGGRAVAVWC